MIDSGRPQDQAERGHKVEAAPPEGGQMNPGDEAPPDTPGTGENICPVCGGKGRLAGGEECRNCGGTGRVIEAVSAGP